MSISSVQVQASLGRLWRCNPAPRSVPAPPASLPLRPIACHGGLEVVLAQEQPRRPPCVAHVERCGCDEETCPPAKTDHDERDDVAGSANDWNITQHVSVTIYGGAPDR